MGEVPETRYAKTDDGAHIAFQVLGEGPLDLVFMTEGASNVELAWEIPAYHPVFRHLASFGRLIRFDTRGSGLSDPLGLSEQPSLEGQATDMLTVLDAVGAKRAAVVATAGADCWRSSSPRLIRTARPRSCSTAAMRDSPERPTTPGEYRRRS